MWWKTLALLSMLLVGAGAYLALTTKSYLLNYLTVQAELAGCVEPLIRDLSLGMEKIRVGALSCDWRNPDGLEIEFRGESVEIAMDWRQLYSASGAMENPITKLRIDSLFITLPKQGLTLPELMLDLRLPSSLPGTIFISSKLTPRAKREPVWEDKSLGLKVALESSTTAEFSLQLDKGLNLLRAGLEQAASLRLRFIHAAKSYISLLNFATVQFQPSQLSAKLSLVAVGSYAPNLPLELTLAPDTGTGVLRAKGALNRLSGQNLVQFSEYLPDKLKLNSLLPSVTTEFQLEQFQIISGRLRADLKEIQAAWGAGAFSGGEIRIDASLRREGKRLWIQPNFAAEIAKYDPGIPLEQLRVAGRFPRFESSPEAIEIEKLAVNLLGGSVSLKRAAKISLAAPGAKTENRPLQLAIQQLQLGKLLELDPEKRVLGDGVLDGSIPLQITGESIGIQNGRLESRAPGGVIKVQSKEKDALQETNEGLKIAMQALDDFRYENLVCGIEFGRSGRLLLKLSLKGKNPKLYDGKAIDLNVNVEQNLWQLMKSLQVVDQLDEGLDRKYSK